jgi:hypothetical protein
MLHVYGKMPLMAAETRVAISTGEALDNVR